MTLVSAIAEIQATCEELIKAHEYDPESDGCKKCDLSYPCYARVTAEDVVTGLVELARLDSPCLPMSGQPKHMEEKHGSQQ